jgi:DNA-binding winged helix-turn-helix (wHTH) protein/predicted ATPase
VPDERRIHFAPFALDLVNQCLWKDTLAIKLRPKAFGVLEHLLSRPGQLVTKDDLLAAVWQDTFVGDAVLKVAIREIREALSDDAKMPLFIETAHRRGYRFIGRLGAGAAAAAPARTDERHEIPRAFVGRDQALQRLGQRLEHVRGGSRRVVFVTGEAGIGKTTLLDAFAAGVARTGGLRICSGQCLEQYGMSEAYLPVLDAIGQLCREDARAVDVLRAHAPMWLMQMPSLVSSADREALGREASGATPERMLREMGDALEALAADAPLVLVLEDLHWSDFSTLDLISYVARRRGPARLMLLATYRPAELVASGHPLKTVKQDLLARQQCEELALEYLTSDAVAQHLAARFPGHRFPGELAALIHERTEGSPLFMVSTIEHLIAERLIEPRDDGWRLTAALDAVKVGVPDSIRQLIETQIDRLDARDRRILEAASVAGAEFHALAVSAALDEPVTEIEARCEELGRRHQFIRECGVHVLPTGEAVSRHGFVHAVYRHVFYERLSASRRLLFHRGIGRRGEELYGDRAHEIAAELAMHYERAGDPRSAARFLQQAAHKAILRSAYREAIALSRRGLRLLETLPDSDERAALELRLHLTLGVPLIATEGYAAQEVGRVYKSARALCERLGTVPELSQVLWGLWTFHILQAEMPTALGLADELLRLAERAVDPDVAMRGHWTMSITCTHQGEFRRALDHFERALALHDPDRYREQGFRDALSPEVALRCFAAWSLWFTGHTDRAVACVEEAIALAKSLSEHHGLAHALVFAAIVHQLRGERPDAKRHADAAMALSLEHGLVLYQAMARIVGAWAASDRRGDAGIVDRVREGLDAWHGTGARLMRPHFLALLIDVSEPASAGDALDILDEALAAAESTGEGAYDAELYRLKGELLLERVPADVDAAEVCFEQALTVARRQDALSLELRAAVCLGRLRQHYGRPGAARDLVAPIYARFEEGFQTPDMCAARAFLDLCTAGGIRVDSPS